MGGLNENGPKDSCIRMLNPVSGTVWEGSGGVAFLVRGAGSLGVGLRVSNTLCHSQLAHYTLLSLRVSQVSSCVLSLPCACGSGRYKLSATA